MTVTPESRREQLRNAAAMCRRRRKHGLVRRSIDVPKAQLDALEVKGYLDPDLRRPSRRRGRGGRAVPHGCPGKSEIDSLHRDGRGCLGNGYAGGPWLKRE